MSKFIKHFISSFGCLLNFAPSDSSPAAKKVSDARKKIKNRNDGDMLNSYYVAVGKDIGRAMEKCCNGR